MSKILLAGNFGGEIIGKRLEDYLRDEYEHRVARTGYNEECGNLLRLQILRTQDAVRESDIVIVGLRDSGIIATTALLHALHLRRPAIGYDNPLVSGYPSHPLELLHTVVKSPEELQGVLSLILPVFEAEVV